jgi:hypothetical protein
VRTFSGSATTYNFTTQIFFAEGDSAAVFSTSPYHSRSGRDTTNEEDMIYEQEAQAGNVLMPTLSGSASSGYSGTVGIGLGGLPAVSSTGRGGSGSSSGSLGLRAGERIAAEAELLRGGRTVAHKRIAALAPRQAQPRDPDRRRHRARLKLTLTDRAGNERTIRHSVQLPAA